MRVSQNWIFIEDKNLISLSTLMFKGSSYFYLFLP